MSREYRHLEGNAPPKDPRRVRDHLGAILLIILGFWLGVMAMK